MSEEGFLRRWARRKADSREGREPAPEPADAAPPAFAPIAGPSAPVTQAPPAGTVVAAGEAGVQLPTMDDVAALQPESDFSAFVARGVDQAVRRSALKKLFADPHFKLMDGLDIYIDDYTKPSPVSEEMLASLQHAKSVFTRMLGAPEEAEEAEEAEEQTKQAPPPPPEQETQ